jgi:hypothetical protein
MGTGPAAHALDVRSGEVVTIAAGEVLDDDLYAAANLVVVDGVINGDLVTAAETVAVNGRVSGDLVAAGRTVRIDGEVGDDVRMVGAELVVGDNATVGDHVMAAGASLHAWPGSRIAGDFSFGGAQALLAGVIGGDAMIGASALEVRGTVDGALTAELEPGGALDTSWMSNDTPSVAPGLTLTEGATVGALAYSAPRPGAVAPGTVQGNQQFTQVAASPERWQGRWRPVGVGIKMLRQAATVFLIGLIATLAAPRWTSRVADRLVEKPVQSLGLGFAGAVCGAFAILSVAALAVVLSISLGLVSFGGLVWLVLALGGIAELGLVVGLTLSLGYVAAVIASVVVGRWILRAVGSDRGERPLLALVSGLPVYVALWIIPVVGALFAMLVGLFGLGAVLGDAWAHRPRRKSPEAAISPSIEAALIDEPPAAAAG